jgi:hypothetical protein
MILAAQATDLCHGGSFNLQDGLEAFLAAYTTPRVVRQAFNVDLVYDVSTPVAAGRRASDAASSPPPFPGFASYVPPAPSGGGCGSG